MTAPYSLTGFPEEKEILSGEPQDDPGKKPEISSGGQSLKTIGKGFWLEGPPEKVAKDIDTRWNAQNKGQKTGLARGDMNEQRRAGNPYVKLVKDTDQDTYRVYTPRGIEQAPPSLNKTDDLCVKVVSTILTDPPKAECEPSSDNDDDRSSAEFSTRVLMNESTESGLNIPELVRDAEEMACSWGSGFVYAYVDPQGGGHRPKEIMAPAGATEIGPDGQPVLEAVGPDGVPVPIAGQPTIRYVGADGKTITDDPAQAMLEWLPKACAEILTRKNLRFIPETCTGIRDADGVMIAAFDQLGDLKAKFPNVAKMSNDELAKLVSYRPAPTAKLLLPKHAGNGDGTKSGDYDSSKGPPDDALVLTITGIMRGGPQYPLGAYVVMGGEKFVLHREEWSEQIPGKAPGSMVSRAMDINIAQFRQFKDTRTKDPHGRGLVDRVGDGDPLVSFAIGAIVEYLHRVNNPHQYIPIGSGIQAKSGQLPRGSAIYYNASGGGKPSQEEIAPLPTAFMDFITFVRQDQDSVSGLQQAAQGVEDPSVTSGKHAQTIIEQALVALSGVKGEMEAGYCRLCRIVLQLVRKYYTVPQRLKIVGEDGSFKEKEWMGTDLGSTVDVKIMAGTSTMLSPSAKSNIALEKFQAQAISQEDYQRSEEGNVRTLIGAQDNPYKTRINGQIARWKEGPPDNWLPPQPQIDPTTGLPPVDVHTGQPLPPPPDPANPFADARGVDQEQAIATIRHNALARAVSGTKFETKPAEWQAYLVNEFEAMRRAAGVMTLAEQQAAQQAQQQQQVAQQQQAVQQQAQQQQQADQQKLETEKAGQNEAEQAKHSQTLSLEDHKASHALKLEEARHKMALEQKRLEAGMAAVGNAKPSPKPVGDGAHPTKNATTYGGVHVEPPDFGPLAEVLVGVQQIMADMQQTMEATQKAIADLAGKKVAAPIVHVPAPVVNVHPTPVHVPAPIVNVPKQPAPQVTVNPEKRKKRKGTITGPDGKKYTVESSDEDDK